MKNIQAFNALSIPENRGDSRNERPSVSVTESIDIQNLAPVFKDIKTPKKRMKSRSPGRQSLRKSCSPTRYGQTAYNATFGRT